MKRTYLLIILVALSTFGCAKTKVIDPEFSAHVDTFAAEAQARGITVDLDDIIVVFGETEGPTKTATCYRATMKTPRVAVQQDKWKNLTPELREQLIFHELGHCILDREHRGELNEEHQAVSIMFPSLVDGELYESHRPEYIDELFSLRDSAL